jgi:hypothetical protein
MAKKRWHLTNRNRSFISCGPSAQHAATQQLAMPVLLG